MQHSGVQGRRQALKNILLEHGDASTATLAGLLDVSEATVRRDLAELKAMGELRRTYGGAVPVSSNVYASSHDQKAGLMTDEKARIGRLAASLVCPSDIIYFDSGTTVMQIASAIASSISNLGILTAITHSVPIIELLGQVPGVRMIALGGVYNPNERANMGPDTISRVRELEADRLFLGCTSVSLQRGLGGPDPLESEVELAMVERARQVILVADHTKFEKVVVWPRIAISTIHTIVTDRETPDELIAELRSLGKDVLIA